MPGGKARTQNQCCLYPTAPFPTKKGEVVPEEFVCNVTKLGTIETQMLLHLHAWVFFFLSVFLEREIMSS